MDATLLTEYLQHIPIKYWFGAVGIGTFFFGESIIVTAFVFTTTQQLSFQNTFLAAFIGTVAADLFWYFIATSVLHKTRLHHFIQKKAPSTSLHSIFWVADRYPYSALLFIKFLVGIRIALAMAIIIRTKISLGKFMFFDSIGAIIFISLLGVIGRIAGSSLVLATSIYETIATGILSIIIISVILHFLSHRLLTFIKARSS